METEIIQNSNISESRFEKGLRITSNVFLILGGIIFIVLSLVFCDKENFGIDEEIFVSCLNYVVLIYLVKFITIKPTICQVIIIPVIILIIIMSCYFLEEKREEQEKFLKYPIFSFISEVIITSIMVISMLYVIYLYFIKEDQTFRDHTHWFFVILGGLMAICSVLITTTLWRKKAC